jgi:hypothetical protein
MRAGADGGTVQPDSGREPRVTLIEPDVALTDFGLAAECALFAGWLYWRGLTGNSLRRWFVVLFVALGLGALLGGITHGFLPDAGSDAARIVWNATLIAIGVAACASWAVGAHVLFAEPMARWFLTAAALLFALNVAVVLYVSQSFLVAIAFYAPAIVFALIAFVLAYRASGAAVLLSAIAGIVLSLIAAVIQQTHTGIVALGLSHNALYHLVQAAGLLLIFLTARGLGACRPQLHDVHVSRETN